MIKGLLGILVLVLAVGCGGSSSEKEHAAEIYTLTQRVQQATDAADSHRFRASWEVGIPEQEATETLESGQVTTEGEFAAPHRVHLRHLALDPDLLPVPYEVLYDGNRVFLKVTEEATWEESTGAIALGLSALLAGPALGEVLQWMLTLRDVEFLPGESVDGVESVHLRGSVRSRGLFDRPMSVEHEGMLELWIGEDDDLIRRALYEVTTVRALAPGTGSSSFESEQSADVYFYDYGADIAIDAPVLE
jgi:hypothetical protein